MKPMTGQSEGGVDGNCNMGRIRMGSRYEL